MADFFENIAPRVGVTADQFARLSGPEALQLYVSSLERAGVSQQEMTFYLEAMASDTTRLIPLLQNGGAEMTRLGAQAQTEGRVVMRSQPRPASRCSTPEPFVVAAAVVGRAATVVTALRYPRHKPQKARPTMLTTIGDRPDPAEETTCALVVWRSPLQTQESHSQREILPTLLGPILADLQLRLCAGSPILALRHTTCSLFPEPSRPPRRHMPLAVWVAQVARGAAMGRLLQQVALAHQAAQMQAPAVRVARVVIGGRLEPAVAQVQTAITAVARQVDQAELQVARCACSRAT